MSGAVFILLCFYTLLWGTYLLYLIEYHPRTYWTGYKIILCLLFLPASVLYFVGSWLHKILSKEI